MFIQSSSFCDIANVEFDFLSFFPVSDRKIEPLGMPSGVGIYPQKDIKSIGSRLNDAIEVSRLKRAVEDDLILEVESGIHALKRTIKDRIFVMTVGS